MLEAEVRDAIAQGQEEVVAVVVDARRTSRRLPALAASTSASGRRDIDRARVVADEIGFDRSRRGVEGDDLEVFAAITGNRRAS